MLRVFGDRDVNEMIGRRVFRFGHPTEFLQQRRLSVERDPEDSG
jgi:hypothetical protein